MAREDLLDPVEAFEMKQAFAQPATGQDIAVHQSTTVDITEGVITARKVEVRRDEAVILQKIAAQAAAAGEHWYYAFPVKKRGGGTDTIEGPSIKCANAVARLYGNCQVDCRVLDAGKSWLIYARFVDVESGFSLTRPFQQSKTGSQLGGKDDERREQASLSIGVSKAERNVICNALETFTDYAFESAKANLVARVGKRLDEYKQRCIDRLGELGVETKRAERNIGKTVDAWVARDVAKLIAEIKSVQDGMATAEDTWPSEAPPEPRRTDDVEDATVTAGSAAADRPAAETGPAVAAESNTSSPPVSGAHEIRKPASADVAGGRMEGPAISAPASPPSGSPSPTEPSAPASDIAGGEPAAGDPAAPVSPPSTEVGAGRPPDLSMPLESWRVGDDALGQEAIIKRLDKLIGLAETGADLDAIQNENAERLAKITGNRRAALSNAIRAKRETLP